jgi:hypothetical protein
VSGGLKETGNRKGKLEEGKEEKERKRSKRERAKRRRTEFHRAASELCEWPFGRKS